ncbi:MAG: hypothetical protein WAT53_04725 [Nitrosomonas sp.]|jgi:hypothetical protein|nr:hypothetical protein [Nitrosomonas sp.]MCC7135782.1 hypothetical protein [Nitrosomonas sp.]
MFPEIPHAVSCGKLTAQHHPDYFMAGLPKNDVEVIYHTVVFLQLAG